ncbi:MAG: hypothetical protein WA902_01800 [Thermosynechococcaceae cyanobacterium]
MMTHQPRIPDAQTRARSVTKMREICAMFDEQIAVLDQLSAQIEAENQKHPFHLYWQKRKQQRIDDRQQQPGLIPQPD